MNEKQEQIEKEALNGLNRTVLQDDVIKQWKQALIERLKKERTETINRSYDLGQKIANWFMINSTYLKIKEMSRAVEENYGHWPSGFTPERYLERHSTVEWKKENMREYEDEEEDGNIDYTLYYKENYADNECYGGFGDFLSDVYDEIPGWV